jgi:hypothetical protein
MRSGPRRPRAPAASRLGAHSACANRSAPAARGTASPPHCFVSCDLERVKGIEPSSSAWKAVALPLSYTRELNSAPKLTERDVILGISSQSISFVSIGAGGRSKRCSKRPQLLTIRRPIEQQLRTHRTRQRCNGSDHSSSDANVRGVIFHAALTPHSLRL